MIEEFYKKATLPVLHSSSRPQAPSLLYWSYMKTNGNDKALEAYKVFPYVAWALTLAFAYFVYNITMELKTVTEDLQVQTQFLVEKINAQPGAIQDYERPTTTNQR